MVTGIETAGVVLAVLPLVVNQLDAYVQGIETLKGFRTRRYRRQFEEWSTRLGAQHAILINTLEQALEGLVDYDDDLSELINNPRGPMWKDAAFQKKLAIKLDRNYQVFIRVVTELAVLLETLSRKLGLEVADPLKISWNDSSTVEREVKKFKDVFSKSIYAELLSKIDSTNSCLKTLVDQSQQRQESRRKQRVSMKPLLRYKAARRHAENLYNAVVRGKGWKCKCKDSHCVHLRIEPEPIETDIDTDATTKVPKFRMAFSTSSIDVSVTTLWDWEEVETVPVLLETPTAAQQKKSTTTSTTAPQKAVEKKVKFAVVTTLQTLPWPKVLDIPPALPIPDFCSALHQAATASRPGRYLGSVSDEHDASHRYCLYLMEKQREKPQTHSLEDLLNSSSHPADSQVLRPAYLFSRRDRLRLATTLASSVLQYHGSWLKGSWRSRDILFPTPHASETPLLEAPYLSGHSIQDSEKEQRPRTRTNPLISSDILFPLGLVLVELSLCQPISALRTPEDEDIIEAYANLKTATRVLDRVYTESGWIYGDVVTSCFRWSDTRNSSEDDEDFQQLVLQKIVSPLVEELRDFEGKGRIH